MKEYQRRTLNIFIFSTVMLMHTVFGLLELDSIFSFSNQTENSPSKKVSLKIKKLPKVRNFGVKESKRKELDFTPSKKQDGQETNLFKKFAISDRQAVDSVKTKQSSYSKKEVIQKSSTNKRRARSNFVQQQIMNEAVAQKRNENPLANDLNYNVKFLPPKGISPDEFNEFEKVFYSFFKRIAVQYINSINLTIQDSINEKPYVESALNKHRPGTLSAMIRYDENGNAEMVKILKSSYNDEVHKIFEKALLKMDKIPNVANKLKDENGKYTAYYQLSINQSRN